MKKLYFVLVLMFAVCMQTYAQQEVSGTVTDAANGGPLPGVNVVVTSTAIGTITDFDGKYTLEVPEGSTQLTFSYVGYGAQTLDISGGTLDVSLSEGVDLERVVVTALGISKKEKSLGYAVQDLDGDGFTQARETNIVNSLNGKVAGVQINNSSGAVGSSSRITLRGATSLTGNNEPLFVIDGVPINNTNYGDANSGGGFDQPNGIADINPDDIESISVLKGPGASALYGLRGANGVILITTKKGKIGKKGLGISFNSSTTFEKPLLLPSFQNSYGQGYNHDYFEFVDGTSANGGQDESWGAPLDRGLEFVQWNSDGEPTPWVSRPDNIASIYETGITNNNNLSFTGATENMGYRLSLGTMNQTGIVPNTDFNKYNVSAASNIKIADKITSQIGVQYIKSQSGNLPTVGYTNENPVQQTLWGGRQVDFEALKDYENLPLAPAGTAAEGTPANWNTNYQNNLFWLLNNNLNQLDKDRLIGHVSLGYQMNDMFNIRLKTGADTWAAVTKEQKAIGSNEFPEGFFRQINRNFIEINSEVLLMFNKDVTSDLDVSFNLGANRMDRTYNRLWGEAGQLELPELYTLSNIKSGVSPVLNNKKEEQRINSVFATGQIGFKDAIYLDFSGRNDWSSVLPLDNNSFFYPAVSVSTIFTDLFDIQNSTFSFLKARIGYAEVGSSGVLEAYDISQTYAFRDDQWGSLLLPYYNQDLANPNILPERTKAWEYGLDARFFRNRLRVDFTYYDQKSFDLIVPAEVSGSTGFETALRNIGEMRNRGVELQLGATVFKNSDAKIDLTFNFAKNNNEVVSLAGLETLTIGDQWSMTLQAREGLPYGIIVGPAFAKDPDGNVIHEDGLPILNPDVQVLGDIQPDWTGGVSLDAGYKGLTFNVIIDARKGSDIYSMTNAWGRYSGVLNETLFGRETGVVGEGVKVVGEDGNGDPIYAANDIVRSSQAYNRTSFDNAIVETSVFDASFVKLRQLMIGYSLPNTLFNGKVFQGASIALVGRNLAILHKNAPHIDPESAFSSKNEEQGQEFGQLPSTRSIGFNLNFKF
ncbi:MAG: SusC/RagA family TonB-linked outer membrane protein [Chitinophagales bacterium]